MMYCKKCGKEIHPQDKFCNNCGTQNEQITFNKSKTMLINGIRIFDALLWFVVLVFSFIEYIDLLYKQGTYSYATIIFVAPLLMVGILLVGLIILLNILGGKTIIIGNIRASAIMQLIPSAILTLGFFNMAFIYSSKPYGFALICLAIAVLELAFNIYKLILLKDIKTITKNKNNGAFIVGYFFIVGFVLVSMLISAFFSTDCNEHYELNEEHLKEQLNSYTYIGESEVEYDATGFECRSKEIETYIYFYDKYNNKINLTISDSNKGKIDLSRAKSDVAEIQFVNNILNNQKLKIVYDDEYKWYDVELNDNILEQYFTIGFSIWQSTSSDDVILHSYDIKNTDYKLTVYLYDIKDSNIDEEFIKPYLNSFVSYLYEKAGSEHIKKIDVHLPTETITVKDYSLNNVIWDTAE